MLLTIKPAEWFAYAGLNRGGIESGVTVMDRLNFAERDTLYEGKVNPICAFMVKELLLSVKRLYNVVQVHWTELTSSFANQPQEVHCKFCKILALQQNVESATRNRFLNIVNPFLENVQQRADCMLSV